jgi:hypothetical protein
MDLSHACRRALRLSVRRQRGGGVRHIETNCTEAQQNGGEQTGERIEKTEANRSGPKPTVMQTPLSGPRYWGSNPYLPATRFPSQSLTSLPESPVTLSGTTLSGRWPLHRGDGKVQWFKDVNPSDRAFGDQRGRPTVDSLSSAPAVLEHLGTRETRRPYVQRSFIERRSTGGAATWRNSLSTVRVSPRPMPAGIARPVNVSDAV